MKNGVIQINQNPVMINTMSMLTPAYKYVKLSFFSRNIVLLETRRHGREKTKSIEDSSSLPAMFSCCYDAIQYGVTLTSF